VNLFVKNLFLQKNFFFPTNVHNYIDSDNRLSTLAHIVARHYGRILKVYLRYQLDQELPDLNAYFQKKKIGSGDLCL
jgi:hypothetical protein